MLNQRLQQKLLQKLSPQQIQLIKLLEVPTFELEQRIKKEIEENPALEMEDSSPDVERNNEEEQESTDTGADEFSLEDYLNDEDVPSYKLSVNNRSKDDERREIPISGFAGFHEQLMQQLGLRKLTEKQRMLAEYIIGNLDDDGYLRRSLQAISDDLAFIQNIHATEDELDDVLMVIQDFDPAGIGARDLQECLVLQMERRDQSRLETKIALSILKHHFVEFSKKHFDKIISRLSISQGQLKAAMDEILKLNPKPGGAFSDPREFANQTVIPDFILENENGELSLSLNNSNVPELRVSHTYSNMIEAYSANKNSTSKQQKEALGFIKQKLDSARWFIDAIRQRQNTLLLTMNAIVEYQREYFLDGDERKLKPMILKVIADRTGLDISTISRVANSKYVQTDFGIIPLKYFFSEAMQTTSGEEVSSREIKTILQECIEGESKEEPLTDEELTDILIEKGYQIARRTVAKYREQLNIPVARMRKEL